MNIYYIDTSAVIDGALSIYDHEHIYLSPIILMELENLKTNGNEHLKHLARQAIREIIESKKITMTTIPQKKIVQQLKKHNFLMDINDHKMLCEALILKEYNPEIKFITNDCAQYLFARTLDLQCYYLNSNENQFKNTDYCGWSKHYPNEEQMAMLYSDPEINSLNLKVNEYAKIYENDKLKDILFWNGEKYRPLNYRTIKNKFLGDTLKPLNIEQKMAFDLLQNNDITVKLLQGVPGGGKDLLMIYHALDLIQRGEIDKIIFIRNLVPFKDAPEIGFIKGSLQEKLEWGLGPLSSLLGEEALAMYEEQGAIEAMNLGFIRGCSWDKSILYVSEGQNLTGGSYKLLVSRCGKGSQLWINGDIFQTDDKKFEKNNGIERLISSLSGHKLFGTVKLIKTERSETAELASII